jgi:hypothetical protein
MFRQLQVCFPEAPILNRTDFPVFKIIFRTQRPPPPLSTGVQLLMGSRPTVCKIMAQRSMQNRKERTPLLHYSTFS